MILITGGTGLVGSHLLYSLTLLGKKVRALKRSASSIRNVWNTFSYYSDEPEKLFELIEWFEGDIEDVYSMLDAMDGVTEVYHAAALVSFDPKDEKALWKANVEGTGNMVNAALEKKISKFCYVSSVAAVGKEKLNVPITEETYWKLNDTISNYSISKYSAEQEVWRANEEGLNVVIVNPSFIIGPGNWNSATSSNAFNTVYKGLPFYSGGRTGFVDVRDVVKTMILLMECDVNAQRYIISAENVTFKEFFDIAHECMGKRKPSIKVGKMLSETVWRAEKVLGSLSGYKPLITKETANSAQQVNTFSNQKIKELLNYDFIPLKESIKHTCEMYLLDKPKENKGVTLILWGLMC